MPFLPARKRARTPAAPGRRAAMPARENRRARRGHRSRHCRAPARRQSRPRRQDRRRPTCGRGDPKTSPRQSVALCQAGTTRAALDRRGSRRARRPPSARCRRRSPEWGRRQDFESSGTLGIADERVAEPQGKRGRARPKPGRPAPDSRTGQDPAPSYADPGSAPATPALMPRPARFPPSSRHSRPPAGSRRTCPGRSARTRPRRRPRAMTAGRARIEKADRRCPDQMPSAGARHKDRSRSSVVAIAIEPAGTRTRGSARRGKASSAGRSPI